MPDHTYNLSGRSANVVQGHGTANIKEQRIATLQADQATVNAQRWSPNTFIFPLPWSDIPAASFLNGLVNEQQGIAWNDQARRFSRQEDLVNLEEEMRKIWSECLHCPLRLGEALGDFRERVLGNNGHRSPSKDSSIDVDTSANGGKTWPSLMQAAWDELESFRRRQNPDFLLPSRTQDAVNDLDSSLKDVFTWLGGLPTNEFRMVHCEAISSILSAMADGHELADHTLPKLAEITTTFAKSTHYVNLCDRRRLTLPLIRNSVAIYELLSDGLMEVLKTAPTSRKPDVPCPPSLERAIDNLAEELTRANMDAKIANDPETGGLSKIFDGQMPTSLNIINNSYYFLSSNPLASTQGQVAMPANVKENTSPQRRLRKRRRIASSSERPRRPSPKREPQPSRPPLGCEELLAMLSFSPESTKRHIFTRASPSLVEPLMLSRLSAATHTSTFQRWLRDETSASALLIHGPYERGDGASPLSFLCAALAQSYTARLRIVVLSYFCEAGHDDGSVPSTLRGAPGLIADVIGQLLWTRGIFPLLDLRSLTRREVRRLAAHNFTALCQLFLRLVEQLCRYELLIFFLVDGISTYETADMERLLSTLRDMVDGQSGERRSRTTKMVFKLLVTDPVVSSWAQRYFEEGEIVSTEEDAHGGHGSETLPLDG